ncbi:carboxypeptidase regulatory-like domain-containing protein [Salinadaptatus halalkaliphilus]|uniref:Carboxypeptidase regulatory-like domain-containing protein n=1 Tax=Salinadaptatus halalkaliphilus TaxID=2419781 RepID=A0A4S3TQH2_9EURY|nr:Ig-like domain-containing protein [Salinadaptatus halalkaliphilus]THE64798.1 carboxypeptidase regulatory-like domain-containing protein [Salinadaptatus halalkaliphilus]
MRVERQLVLEVERHELPVGRPVTVRVRDRSGRPVEDATVAVGSTRERTDARGYCTISLRSPGFWKIVASKPSTDRHSYRSISGLLRVLPRSQRARAMP